MPTPVTIIDSGGTPVTNTTGASPFTPVDNGGAPVTLVDSGGLPVTLVNDDLTPWTDGPLIVLSASTVAENAASGTAVGTLSISGDYTGTPSYTLDDSAGGKFAIDGDALEVASALDYETATSHVVTISVSGITPAIDPQDFTITVTNVFEPSDLGSTLVAWWDASQSSTITLNVSAVSAWASRVGSYNLTQATAALQPAYSATGWDGSRAAITGDGLATNGDYLASSTGPFGANLYALIVAERGTQQDGAASSVRPLLISSNTSGGDAWRVYVLRPTADAGQTQFVTDVSSVGAVASTVTSFANGAKAILAAKRTTAPTTRLNGGTEGSAGSFGATASDTASALELFGHSSVAVRRFAGKIAEVIVLDAEPSTLNRQKLEGYVAHKWGITSVLASDHPYKSVAP